MADVPNAKVEDSYNGTPTKQGNGNLPPAMNETTDSIIFNFAPVEKQDPVEMNPALEAILSNGQSSADVEEIDEDEEDVVLGSTSGSNGSAITNDYAEDVSGDVSVASSGPSERPDLRRRSVSAKILLFENIAD